MSSQVKTFRAEDQGGNLGHALRELFSYRELLLAWALREIKVRYKQSLLGVAWALLQPLSLMVIYTIVFSFFIRVPSDGIPYPLFSYTALLPWTFFAACISFGVPSLINNMNLVTKVYFPREIFPLASIGANFIDFLVASLLYIGLLVYYRVPLGFALVWLPVILCGQIVLSAGVVLFASAVNVFYRDVRFVIPLAVQLWLYASPVIYPVSVVPEQFRIVYMFNPMAGFIEGYRTVLLQGQTPNLQYLAIALATAALFFVTGYIFFKRVEMNFADVI
jgi:homopolymeric O-antigen transport system permease protein